MNSLAVRVSFYPTICTNNKNPTRILNVFKLVLAVGVERTSEDLPEVCIGYLRPQVQEVEGATGKISGNCELKVRCVVVYTVAN